MVSPLWGEYTTVDTQVTVFREIWDLSFLDVFLYNCSNFVINIYHDKACILLFI